MSLAAASPPINAETRSRSIRSVPWRWGNLVQVQTPFFGNGGAPWRETFRRGHGGRRLLAVHHLEASSSAQQCQPQLGFVTSPSQWPFRAPPAWVEVGLPIYTAAT